GYLPVWLAQVVEAQPQYAVPLSDWHILPTIAALAALIGHSKSIFLKFQGGKSAATALGTLLACQIGGGLAVFALWVFLVWATRIVSIASITAGLFSPISMFLFHAQISYVAYAGV